MGSKPSRRFLKPVEKSGPFPDELFQGEWPESKGAPPRVGVALSGGGIRSATLSLGLFQGLARLKLLRHVDYLSTVSGGGYFGAFLGHLFLRQAIKPPPTGKSEPEKSIVDRVEEDLADDQGSNALKFLRENGRYLSPNGSGDTFFGAAIAFRNWCSVMSVMGLFALLLLTLAVLGLHLLESGLVKLNGAFPASLLSLELPFEWLSPFFILAAAAVLLFVVPTAWSYWLVPDNLARSRIWQFAANWLVPVAGVLGPLWALFDGRQALLGRPLLLWGTFVVSLFTLLRYGLGRAGAAWLRRRRRKGRVTVQEEDEGWLGLTLRRDFSRGLMRSLIVVAILLGLGVVDSIGRIICDLEEKGMASAVYGPLIALIGIFRGKIVDLTRRMGAHEKPVLPINLLMYAAALILSALFLGAIASVPHFVANGGGDLAHRFPEPPDGYLPRLIGLAAAAALLAGLSGRVWSFVNRSSLHALYEARLRRAYLGASNPARIGEGDDRPPVTEPDLHDGFPFDQYHPARHGGPVHLINVTVNETVDGRSQVQQQDRKGMGMAIGPGGVSVGRQHHATWKDRADADGKDMLAGARERLALVSEWCRGLFARADGQGGEKPADSLTSQTAKKEAFRVFPREAEPEPLDVGQWMAISGAAFSTGLGARTNLGLSLLAGLFNVRLGYWWATGINPAWRSGRTSRTMLHWVGGRLRRLFPVQSSLLDEWLARFPGVARPEWYLSDGGHFENMGGYELIRRRLPFIIVCDNEQDSEYAFEGLANLVRKARIDFGATIDFLERSDLDALVERNGGGRWIGTLADLRRGRRSREDVLDPVTRLERIRTDGERSSLSLAHAALARIRYSGSASREGETGWLLYIKPTLIGDEPVDVLNYHARNPDFPQESTADQYFDEAQWESYRKLGEDIANKLFAISGKDGGASVNGVRKGKAPWSPRDALQNGADTGQAGRQAPPIPSATPKASGRAKP